jgi:hypothetical protein
VGDSLAILSCGGGSSVDALVNRTVLQRTERQLAQMSGAKVSKRVLPNGEVELVANEAGPGEGGAGRVAARIDAQGVVRADVSCLAGARCEVVMAELADAIGGEIIDRRLKEDYYAEPVAPGEPANIQAGV